ncbi:aminopeptidase P family N-terminal domain-containing protein, partial [bacterium]|nr:aminopeptidase P family N-terminal domain-containing protein [bacterium]
MLNAKTLAPITKSDREERIKKAAAKLAENGYSCLVVAGPSNFFYFCGAKGGYSDRLYALVIKCDGTYFYICPSFEERRMRETYGGDAEVLPWQEDQNPCEMIAQ